VILLGRHDRHQRDDEDNMRLRRQDKDRAPKFGECKLNSGVPDGPATTPPKRKYQTTMPLPKQARSEVTEQQTRKDEKPCQRKEDHTERDQLRCSACP
jgi:hypothetical protein